MTVSVVSLPHPADERQRLALLLVAEQRDALHQICGQDEVLDAEHLVDVELSVDEGHARQVIVLQDPQEDLQGTSRELHLISTPNISNPFPRVKNPT